ncbi:hypothetical protein ECH_0107 [Ehrlichia chaffeensis str. Arkansas]|uniref:Uncharacterized protein n=1 Tax=Ehrlichia chaffeensis (strain ATCC CRL-10679 / Arkansas) TaxID=205920 RepID=Q2GHZ8_EHRCR|nr:hypothetical protein ECH_0107 [Ehrlichia chaffeensis str. Arkansas]
MTTAIAAAVTTATIENNIITHLIYMIGKRIY